MIKTSDALLTIAQVVQYLDSTISERTIRRLVASGELRSVRLSTRSVRVRVSAIEEYLNGASS